MSRQSSHSSQSLRDTFRKAMWVPTMIVTFKYVPVKFQVLVVNVVGVVWNTFLAYASINAVSETENDSSNENTSSERKK